MTSFHTATYRNDFRMTRIGDSETMNEYDLYSTMAHEANVVQFYISDLMYDVAAITKADPNTKFIWCVRDMGSHIIRLYNDSPNAAKADDYIDSIRTTWPDSKMYLIHKCSCNAEGEQHFTIHRLTEKSIRPAEIRKQDTINLVEATALRCRNDFYFIKAQHEFIRQDAKDYLNQLSTTLQSIEI